MSSTVSLALTFKTSSARSVHLVGSWDGYRNQLPLSKDAEKRGQWRGVFKMPKAVQNNTYWYYYMIDGYQPTHDPAKPSTVEQTTKRTLNILNLSCSSKPSLSVNTSSSSMSHSSRSRSSRLSSEIPQGRSISPSRIVAPRPQRPNATKTLEAAAMSSLTSSFASLSHHHRISHHQQHSHSSFDSDSDSDLSDVPSLSSSRSSSSRHSPISPASSMSSYSPRSPTSGYSSRSSLSSSSSSTGSCCTCDRYGITRKGERIRMDCGGKVCGDDLDSDCDSAGEFYKTRIVAPKGSKRHGVVVRGH